MEIKINPVITSDDEAAIRRIRREVFEREMGLPREMLTLPENARQFHLLARLSSRGQPFAALSVIDTTGDDELHQRYELDFDPSWRVARYTQLAVLAPYRGMNLPLRLMLEAHRQFVTPGRYDYTWLLFDARRAAQSSLCRLLAFTPSARTVLSEYGRSRVLVRDERTARAKQAVREAQMLFERSLNPAGATNRALVSGATGA
jgi:hypothetical protein